MIHSIPDYKRYLIQKGLSLKTVSQRHYDLTYFFRYLSSERGAPTNLCREAVLSYRDDLATHFRTSQGTLLGEGTIKNRLLAVKDFFRYQTEVRRLFLTSPAQDLTLPKPKRTLPKEIPTHDQIKAVIDSIDRQVRRSVRSRARDKAIFELLYSTGIRRSELLNLNLCDLDLTQKRLMIREGKGRKDRVVPLGEKASHALKQYTEEARPRYAGKSDALFLSFQGNRFQTRMLLRTFMINRGYLKLTPHSLRHACAIGMLQNGADIRYIQALLGHKRLDTTQIYTQVLPRELKAAHTRFHPRGKIHPKP